MLGLVPAAPWSALIVDPELPDWLPEITLSNLRVGEGWASLRFRRDEQGATEHEVIDGDGRLRIHRPAPRTRGADGLPSLLRAVAGS
jgi:hypothetical protein